MGSEYGGYLTVKVGTGSVVTRLLELEDFYTTEGLIGKSCV